MKALPLPVLTLVFSIWCFSTSLQAQPLVTLQKGINTPGLEHAIVAACFYDTRTDSLVYGFNQHVSVVPASLQKLITTAASLDILGADYRYTTRLLMQGEVDRDGVLQGNLYIVGSGDPLLGSYRYRQTTSDTLFGQWTEALRSRGVERIAGRIYYVTAPFEGLQQHPSWQQGDVGNYYGVGATGLNFHENMYFVHFDAGSDIGQPARVVRIRPKNLSLQEHNGVVTGATGSGDRVVVYGLSSSTERVYTGTVPLGAHDFAIRAALPSPPHTCADLLASYLRTHGISVSKETLEASTAPSDVRTVSIYQSPRLRQIVQYTNRTSNNLYAESLFKTIGAHRLGKGSFETGTHAIEEWLDNIGVEHKGTAVVDGSGLSRLDRVTTDMLCRMLCQLTRKAWFNDYLSSLRTDPQRPKVHYKTGSMDGIRAQAGYISLADGRMLTYAIVINQYECSASAAEKNINDIIEHIAQ